MHMPIGRPHSFHNTSSLPARMLVMCVPGGLERYFLDIGTPLGREGEGKSAGRGKSGSSRLKPETTEAEARRATEAAKKYGLVFPRVNGSLAADNPGMNMAAAAANTVSAAGDAGSSKDGGSGSCRPSPSTSSLSSSPSPPASDATVVGAEQSGG